MVRLRRDLPEGEVPRSREAAHISHVQFGQRLISIPLPEGLPTYDEIIEELTEYSNILLGRMDSPIESPYLSLMEVAGAYYARAREIEMLIYDGENSKAIIRGSQYYKLRTGRLNSFIEMSKRLFDLGSRRLSQETLISQQRIDIGETQR